MVSFCFSYALTLWAMIAPSEGISTSGTSTTEVPQQDARPLPHRVINIQLVGRGINAAIVAAPLFGQVVEPEFYLHGSSTQLVKQLARLIFQQHGHHLARGAQLGQLGFEGAGMDAGGMEVSDILDGVGRKQRL